MHRRALNKFLLSAAAFAAGAAVTRATSVVASTDRFIAHEWGTFTTFQGADGSVLEGLHHEEESLPSFVHTVTNGQSGQSFHLPTPTPPAPSLLERTVEAVLPAIPVPAAAPLVRKKFCGKGICADEIRHVTTKMETPVIYFHTDRPRSVKVKVGFENGLLSQFYPAGEITGYQPWAHNVIDMAQIPRTSLAWSLDLIPHGDAATPKFPEVRKDAEQWKSWELARDVKAASVRLTKGSAAEKRYGQESERYVFYRGLGRLDLPLFIEAVGNGQVMVKNGGTDMVPASFLLEMTPQGGRFVAVGKLAGTTSTLSSWSGIAFRSKDEVVADLRERVKAAIIAEGLYEDEAEAMVKTWSRSWFGQEGTRLVYIVPHAVTDRVLPMTIDPVPQELVRVLVGRLEFLTPEMEDEAQLAMLQRNSGKKGDYEKGSKRLDRFGRFQEPVARRIFAKSSDKKVQDAARQIVDRELDS